MSVVAADDDAEILTPVKLTSDVENVTMHPLVLLSAADHYHRVARGTRKRVVGVLLGQVTRGSVDVTNSFAVPFEEDSKNPVSLLQLCLRHRSLSINPLTAVLISSSFWKFRPFFIWITTFLKACYTCIAK